MQLRRGPPEGRALHSPKPALRLVAAPKGAVRAPKTWWSWRTFDSYSVRAVAGLLLVSIPVSILLGFVMSNSSASISIDQAKARAEATAEATAVRIIDYVAERRSELRHMARDTVDKLKKPAIQAHLLDAFASQSSFDGIQIFDPAGKLAASTDPALRLSPTPSGLPFANSMAIETMGPIVLRDATLVWIMTTPILGSDSKGQGVFVANLSVAVLGRLLNPYGLDAATIQDQEVHLVNSQVASQIQRSSTDQVVLAIEHIAEGSRSVAATAQEIAAAAARQGELAADLAGTRWESEATSGS